MSNTSQSLGQDVGERAPPSAVLGVGEPTEFLGQGGLNLRFP
jgi:hypothetical protein